jgi:hypothetical protein
MNVARWLEELASDVPYRLRQLKLNPGFTAVAVLSLALGIGANTAIFQLLDAIRLLFGHGRYLCPKCSVTTAGAAPYLSSASGWSVIQDGR